MSALPPSLDELENTFGVLFIGFVFTLVAYGFTFFQTYIYYSRYAMDHWLIKLTVASLWAIDTTSSALVSHSLYHSLVFLFPSTVGLDNFTSTFCAENMLSVWAIYLVQLFYAIRIWNLSRNAIMVGLITVVSTASFVLGIIMTIDMFRDTTVMSLVLHPLKAIITTAQALSFASALLISCSLYFYFKPSQNPKTRPLQGWLDKLVTHAVSRGLAATLVQFGYLVTFTTMPSRMIWIPFHLVTSKLFVNSLLTMLNSRKLFRGQAINEEETLSSSRFHRVSYTGSGSMSRTNANIQTSVSEVKSPVTVEGTRTAIPQDIRSKSDFDSNWSDHSLGMKGAPLVT